MFSSYRLSRVPHNPQLQAWNAADELAYSRLSSLRLCDTLFINEPFGALMVRLSDEQQAHADFINSSAMSLEAIQQNLARNNLVCEPTAIEQLKPNYPTIVLYPAKSVHYFKYLLQQAANQLSENGTVYIPAMVKHLSKGHIQAMNEVFLDVLPGHAVKKARVIELKQPAAKTALKAQGYKFAGLDIVNLPGCYGAQTLDQGARAFIDHYDLLNIQGKVLDMGCGNGILSLALLQRNADIQLTLVDEHQQALASAKTNLDTHFPQASVEYFHSNGLNTAPKQKYDLIVCNPPFHQENTLTEGISLKLFNDLSHSLCEAGECWIIANRHLDYRRKLKKIFRHVDTPSKDSKFLLYHCRN